MGYHARTAGAILTRYVLVVYRISALYGRKSKVNPHDRILSALKRHIAMVLFYLW
jgi:hypothetical protein